MMVQRVYNEDIKCDANIPPVDNDVGAFMQSRSSSDTCMSRIPSSRTKSSGQRSFSYQTLTTWNQLPVSVRLCYRCQFFLTFLD